MTKRDFVTIHEVVDPAKAELIRMALENKGIACFLEGIHQGTGGIPALGIKIQVPSDQAERARKFVESHETKS